MYLGCEIGCEESSTEDINCRIGKARSGFASMRAIWALNQYTAERRSCGFIRQCVVGIDVRRQVLES